MKTTKLFFMAALALMTAACSNDDNDLMAQQPSNNMITITAKLAPKSDAQTRVVSDDGTNIVVNWDVNEQLEIISDNGYTATANIDNVTGGVATISFSIDAAAVGENCTIVYPASAATTTGVKDYATLLAAQNGTLNANLDVRVGAGIIEDATATLNVTTQPEPQFSIFKFTIQNLSAAAKTATQFKVSDNSGNVITTVTPGPATGTLYVALPAMAVGTYWFNATIDSKPYVAKATTTAATTAGNYYQTTVKMATLGDFILDDGKFAPSSSTGTKVAMITYLGSDTGEAAPNNHGLALALSDANNVIDPQYYGLLSFWRNPSADAGHTKQLDDNFEVESGLQYNDATHDSDTYPAFKAAMANNGTAVPTGCSDWFLPSAYQLAQIINSYGVTNLKTTAGGFTGLSSCLSSSEYDAQKYWDVYFGNDAYWASLSKTISDYVRACLAF